MLLSSCCAVTNHGNLKLKFRRVVHSRKNGVMQAQSRTQSEEVGNSATSYRQPSCDWQPLTIVRSSPEQRKAKCTNGIISFLPSRIRHGVCRAHTHSFREEQTRHERTTAPLCTTQGIIFPFKAYGIHWTSKNYCERSSSCPWFQLFVDPKNECANETSLPPKVIDWNSSELQTTTAIEHTVTP